jgi:pimeloyl-ACP methyl ester carboxylesterase
MKSLLPTLAACALAAAAGDAPFAGDWMGTLDINGKPHRIALHLKHDDGRWSGNFDSLDQGARGIGMDQVEVDGNKLVWKMAAAGIVYEGAFDPASGAISGTLLQGGGKLPLQFKHAAPPPPLLRPQEPKAPFPYVSEAVSYPNPQAEGVRLAGTLTRPKGPGKFPAVLLITGSGAQNRDEEIFGHKPFLLIADFLTRHGIAVLRVDDRGTAESTGKFATATTADFATDVMAGVQFLLKRPEIDAKHIGLLGHSEGGAIAPMVAVRMPEVAFLILLAGTGVPGDETIVQQVYRGNLAGGASEESARQARELERAILNIVKAEPDAEAQQRKLMALAEATPGLQQILKAESPRLNSPWYRYFISHDPRPVLANVKIPVLALNGAKDTQVDAEQNLPAIEAALRKGGNRDVTIKLLPGLNHLFQQCKTGALAEYETIEQTMAPEVLDLIADWIAKRVG